METTQQLGKWGSSLAVRIPKVVAEQCGIIEGERVQLVAHRDGVLIRKHKYDLTAMVNEITPNNIHHEQGFGKPLGKETW